MSPKRHRVIPRVMCLIFTEDKEKIVLMKASKEKDWQGKYDPPGGHIEKKESIIEAANREIVEETSLKPQETQLKGVIHVTGFFNKEIMLFVTTSYTKERKLFEHREGKPQWIELDKLDELNLLEDIKPIIQRIIELNPGEVLVGTSEFDGSDNLIGLDLSIK